MLLLGEGENFMYAEIRNISINALLIVGYLATCVDGEEYDCSRSTRDRQCNNLGVSCWTCNLSMYEADKKKGPTCKYGQMIQVLCTVNSSTQCQGERNFTKETTCAYCYQLDPQYYTCSPVTHCNVLAPAPDNLQPTTCVVKESVLCFGRRKFNKRVPCRWTSGGYKWSTAMILSITLGGFGVDRFYLGLWRSGLGKLFSFGGLGVWTIIDVILIATGYVGPADNTVYIY